MPKGLPLSEFEKGQINTLNSMNWTMRRIAAEINRSDRVVRNYLKNPDAYGTAKSTGRPSVVSARAKRRIIKAASNSTISSAQIASSLNLECTPRTVRRVLEQSEVITRSKMTPCPKLTAEHKANRLNFAEEKLQQQINWDKVF